MTDEIEKVVEPKDMSETSDTLQPEAKRKPMAENDKKRKWDWKIWFLIVVGIWFMICVIFLPAPSNPLVRWILRNWWKYLLITIVGFIVWYLFERQDKTKEK